MDHALLVNALHKTALGRPADAGGLANRVQQLRSGVSLEALAEELTASAEFQGRHGLSQKIDMAFLKAIYRDGLGREPDLDWLVHWLVKGEKGTTRAKFLAAFAGSNEAIRSVATLLVNSLYRTAFGRLEDENGLATHVKQLQSGVSLEALAEELAASPEFQARHGQSQRIDGEYVTALYWDGFGRKPDPEGLGHWLAEGDKGATRAKVLAAFARSDEALRRPVVSTKLQEIGEPSLLINALYRTAFGRPADAGGLANRVQQLRSGVSLEALAEELTASAEFQGRHGLSQKIDMAFLKAIYRDGLGREPDLDWLVHWLVKGEKGTTRAKFLAAFAGSNEAIRSVATLLVNSLYRTAFGRLAGENELATHVKQLQSGVSLEALAEELAASPEFQARHGQSQRIDGEYVTALYWDGFGRKPDPEGLGHWLAEGDKGATRAKVLAAFARSDEALRRPVVSTKLQEIGEPSLLINALYRTAFGRPADAGGLANRVQQLRSGVSLEALAEELTASAEFQERHGLSQKVDSDYLEALYRSGLGREPDLDGLAHWLGEGEEGATRAKVLAAVASSNEAIAAASTQAMISNLHRYVAEVLPRELCERMDAQLMLYTQESQREISAALAGRWKNSDDAGVGV